MKPLRASLTLCALLVASASFAQSSSLPTLYRSGLISGYGCTSFRCFSFGEGMKHGTAVASVTGEIISVQTRNPDNEWVLEQLLTTPDPNNVPTFGTVVALGTDVIMIAGTSRRYNFKDVVYVYTRTNGVWSHIQTLSMQRPEGYFTTYVSDIVIDGDVALIAGTRVSNNSPAPTFLTRVEIYIRNANGTFTRRGAIDPPTGQDRQDPYAVALSGSTAVIGDAAAATTGRAYVYERTAGGWLLRARLQPTDTSAEANFGTSVAIDGASIAVGASARPNDAFPDRPGAIYMYGRDPTSWQPRQVVLPPEESAEPEVYRWQFARSVALQGARLLTTGSEVTLAYLYQRSLGTWSPVARLDGAEFAIATDIFLSKATAMIEYSIEPYGFSNYVFELPDLYAIDAGQ